MNPWYRNFRKLVLLKWLAVSLLFIQIAFSPVILSASSRKEEFTNNPSSVLNTPESDKNNFPIILVHGFMGFGRKPENRYFYWGGTTDLQENLKREGFDVRTAEVGPVSSNWDRACELYAYIKGGRVDYGKIHSEKFGHKRYGDFFRGIYPEWGEINPETGNINKIHIISHSMGGQTVRLLAQLLRVRTEGEFADSTSQGTLFTGGHSWISSITTISTPHDGTSLTRAVNRNPELIYNILINLTSLHTKTVSLNQNFIKDFQTWNNQNKGVLFPKTIISAKDNLNLITVRDNKNFFDIKLDQWEINTVVGETQKEYRERVWASPVWNDTTDISSWDLSPEGAAELNSWVRASPDIYYFSWATEESTGSKINGWYLPELQMNPFLKTPSLFLGSYTDKESVQKKGETLLVKKDWWKNDGIVNTNSMDGPSINSTDIIRAYTGTPEKGIWNFMGELSSIDHGDIIGIMAAPVDIPEGYENLTDWYSAQCRLLRSLPAN